MSEVSSRAKGRRWNLCILLVWVLFVATVSGPALGQFDSRLPAFTLTTYYQGKQLWEISLPAYGPTLFFDLGDTTKAYLMHTYVVSKGTMLTAADGTSVTAPLGGSSPPIGIHAFVKWAPKGSDCFHAVVRVTVVTGFKALSHIKRGESPVSVAVGTFDDTIVIPMRATRTLVRNADGVGFELQRREGALSSWPPVDIMAADKKCQRVPDSRH